ncbi:MAG: hypothetical protein WB424_07495 [Terracidiphilus sp.]
MRVTAICNCFIDGGRYLKEGEEIEYNGPKNENLISVKKAKALEEEKRAEAAVEEIEQ